MGEFPGGWFQVWVISCGQVFERTFVASILNWTHPKQTNPHVSHELSVNQKAVQIQDTHNCMFAKCMKAKPSKNSQRGTTAHQTKSFGDPQRWGLWFVISALKNTGIQISSVSSSETEHSASHSQVWRHQGTWKRCSVPHNGTTAMHLDLLPWYKATNVTLTKSKYISDIRNMIHWLVTLKMLHGHTPQTNLQSPAVKEWS